MLLSDRNHWFVRSGQTDDLVWFHSHADLSMVMVVLWSCRSCWSKQQTWQLFKEVIHAGLYLECHTNRLCGPTASSVDHMCNTDTFLAMIETNCVTNFCRRLRVWVCSLTLPTKWKQLTDRQTDGRMLPSTLYPCFTVDNKLGPLTCVVPILLIICIHYEKWPIYSAVSHYFLEKWAPPDDYCWSLTGL